MSGHNSDGRGGCLVLTTAMWSKLTRDERRAVCWSHGTRAAPGISQYDPLGNIFFCSLMFAPITFLWQRGWQTFQTFDVFGKASVSIFTIYYIKICTNLFIWLHKIEITHPSHTERFLFVSLSPSSSARWWQLKYATRTATGKSLNRAQMSSASLS